MPVQFPATIELSSLNGRNGFRINGVAGGDWSGMSVASAGDINNDNMADLVIGAPHASPVGEYSGQTYIVFGGSSVGNSGFIELSKLEGSNGFKVNGIAAGDRCGFSVASAGDINADGVADLTIGAYGADPNGTDSGQSYVIFGSSCVGRTGTFELSSLNGANGFKINGITRKDYSGLSVASAGDINGDGIDDLVVGAFNASPNGLSSGQSYIIFGGPSVGGSGVFELSSLSGKNGFKINGIAEGDWSGRSVASAGDFNADGITDLLVGADRASPNGVNSGQSYVIFGSEGVGNSGTIELSNLNGSNGFKLNGIATKNYSGISLASAGDINGDGVADVIVGADGASTNKIGDSGQSYVIFGGNNVGRTGTIELSSLDGQNGFKLNGITTKDYCGISVSSAGDLNCDGVIDVVVGADGANSNKISDSGQSYVIFGGSNIANSGTVELSSLNGHNGFKLNGIKINDRSGRSVASAGDVNGDGVTDLIVGAYTASPNGAHSGQSYLIFGDKAPYLTKNQLFINQGQNIAIHQNDLNATSSLYSPGVLQFIISNIKYGQFKYIFDKSKTIMRFYQQNITDGQVQFRQDWSIYPPVYNVSVFTGRWASTIPEAARIHFGPLLLLNNSLTIDQNGVQLLSSGNLQATDKNTPDNKIIFTIGKLQYGQFEVVSKPGVAINQFSQELVSKNQIQFVQDGTPNEPSYNVIASDGTYTLPTSPSKITFFYAPVLEVNTLSIEQGQTVVLNSGNLQATDKYVSDPELIFSISALVQGHFTFFTEPNIPIVEFSQLQVDEMNVQFTHDGSPIPPSYNVSVKANALISAPQAVSINWTPKLPTPTTPSNNAEHNILIGSFTTLGVFAGLFLCYISMGFLKNRRLNATVKDKGGEQKHFYQEVVIPIAKAIFKQIKVTSFMNYISSKQMEAYVTEIATIINEVSRLGINIEIQHMDAKQSTSLLNQIIKQTKHHLEINTDKFSGAWFGSFFKPQVTPEMISEKAQDIAESVHDALLGKNKYGIISLPTNVDLISVIGQEPTEGEFTTGYVQMP